MWDQYLGWTTKLALLFIVEQVGVSYDDEEIV